ncbi:hypothetical protein BH24ACT22_BH24ACT22_02120 [soil metagenome]
MCKIQVTNRLIYPTVRRAHYSLVTLDLVVVGHILVNERGLVHSSYLIPYRFPSFQHSFYPFVGLLVLQEFEECFLFEFEEVLF